MTLRADSSSTLRKIFGLRREGQIFIRHVIGNDLNTFLWLDNWHSLEPLFQRFGDRVAFNLGRSPKAKVCSIIPRRRNAVIREIIAGIVADLLPHEDREDRVIWTINPNGSYSSKSAWMAL